jgi:hypothetical protein
MHVYFNYQSSEHNSMLDPPTSASSATCEVFGSTYYGYFLGLGLNYAGFDNGISGIYHFKDSVFEYIMDNYGVVSGPMQLSANNCVFSNSISNVSGEFSADNVYLSNNQYNYNFTETPFAVGGSLYGLSISEIIENKAELSPFPDITVTPTGEYTNYETGLFGETRNNVGAFYFGSIAQNYYGHIGAFYFGPVDFSVTVSDILNVSAVLLQPIVSSSNNVSATIVSDILGVTWKLLQPTIYSTQDIQIDFVGVPRIGSSPLEVEFTAIVNLKGSLKNKYKITEYKWCFNYDYDNNVCNEDWVVTTSNPYIHVYRGYAGQKYSVKLCCTLALI